MLIHHKTEVVSQIPNVVRLVTYSFSSRNHYPNIQYARTVLSFDLDEYVAADARSLCGS